MSNWNGRSVDVDKYMCRKAFRAGVDDARKGRPWKYDDYWRSVDLSLTYERARHFAAIWDRPVWAGRGVRREALVAFITALETKQIVA